MWGNSSGGRRISLTKHKQYGMYFHIMTSPCNRVGCRYNAVQCCKIITMITGNGAEYQSDAGYTADDPYVAITGEPWGVICKYFCEKWPRYNGTALYSDFSHYRWTLLGGRITGCEQLLPGVGPVHGRYDNKILRNRSPLHLWTVISGERQEPSTHYGLVTPYGDMDLGRHWLK